ncbi:PQQ-binding-like beta-propeller repeat protein [Haloterrigena sp. H1]|uniref:outer membrane protein assembly factor BamB family protein n=1 Tax=Haloterrigena sp. H1 TaxID=2552943 RepID=UPI0014867424|nr:PQQ-binding-like beta-propeller repeat protein [Haloterrigena sp. H1]
MTDAVYVTKSSDDASSWTSAVEFNGTERWSGIDGSLTYITDNTAYLIEGYSRGDPIVRAIDTSDGSEIWNAPGSSIEPETAATNTPDTVYVAGDQLVALDTAEGSVRWRYEHGDAESDIHVVSNGTAYVTLDREVVVAASGGEELWRVESLSWPNIHAPTDSAVLVTDQNHTRALDAVTGEQQWVQPLGGVQVFNNSDRVYVSKNGTFGNQSTVSALAVDDGSEIWSIEVGTEVPRVKVDLDIIGEENTTNEHSIFIQVDERKLKKVDSDGDVVQTWVSEEEIYDFLVDDFLIVSTDSGIHALDSY